MTIELPAAVAPVAEEVDVLVCGGGLGGVAAATAAARAGARTLLVERNTYLGGVATAGMCCSIFNCYFTSGGEWGTTGIAVEVADRLADAAGFGERWRRHKGHIIYDLEQAKFVLQEMVEAAGATVRLGGVVTGAVVEDDVLQGVIVHTKTGPQALLARVVVDATGDADVAALAGAPLQRCERGLHSLCFRLGNVDVDAFVAYFRDHPEEYAEYMDVEWTLAEALAQYDDCGTFLFPHGGGMQMSAFQQARADGVLPDTIGLQDNVDAAQMHALRQTGIVHVISGFTHFDGLDPDLITRSLSDGRRMVFTLEQVYRKYIPGFANAFVAGTGDNLGVRASRYLDGDCVFTREMLQPGARAADAIGRSVGWENEVRHHGKNAWGAQVLHADSFDIPYGCLLPRQTEGLLMGAGRSVSAVDPFILRTMVQTMVVGQGAGAAAAVAAGAGVTPRGVAVDAVQAELRRQGVAL